MSKRFTAEELSKLREIAEAATPGPEEIITPSHPVFDSTTVLALLDEIERLRNVAIDPGEYGIDEPVVDWKRTAELRAQEIERLRREREVLAEAVRAWDDYAKIIIENGPLAFDDAIDAMEKAEHAMQRAEQRHREALALLDGEKGGESNE